MKQKQRILSFIIFVGFALVAAYELFPLIFLAVGSIKDQSELFSKGMTLNLHKL